MITVLEMVSMFFLILGWIIRLCKIAKNARPIYDITPAIVA